jgi:hypothetical protein
VHPPNGFERYGQFTTLRPLREILKEFRSRPFSYWLGRDEPFTYEVKGDRVFRVSRSNQTEVVVFTDVDQWTKRGRKLVIYEGQTTQIIMDPRNRLGSVLEKHLPEKWIVEEEE